MFLLLTESITNLACKAGVFCSSSNDTIIGTNALPPSWALKLIDSWGELKNYSRGDFQDRCLVAVSNVIAFVRNAVTNSVKLAAHLLV